MTSQLAAVAMSDGAPKKRISILGWAAMTIGTIIMACLIWNNVAHPASHGSAHGPAATPPLWALGTVPFAALLLCIAVLPLLPATHHWWESNLNRFGVAMACAGCTLLYYAGARGIGSIVPVLDHAIPGEYIPFMALLFSLYVISGGISLKGDLAAHPLTNTGFLAFGAAIASFIGTTGASMLLIRPLLQTNSERKHVVHTVVFFIFLVSNIGGTLLPIGDPPLFLGYLRGVDFFWTFSLWGPWAVACVMLLVMYFVVDTFAYRKETIRDIQRDETQRTPLRLRGWWNFALLGGVILAVAFLVPGKPIPGTSIIVFPFLRELVMLGLVGTSLFITPAGVRNDNNFNYTAIIEVAALFIGIFIAMQVPLEVLKVHGASLGLSQPWHFFWSTGTLSAVLDNAPTYLVFFETAGSLAPGAYEGTLIRPDLLAAVSLGAVFMGAMTYIGNGPNFMVKSIAEQSGVRMPSFFGYLVKYAIVFLVPVFLVITLMLPQPDPAVTPVLPDEPGHAVVEHGH